jgi:hypothetical protein
MVESSGQLGGKDDVRQLQGPRLDTSSPDRSPGVESAGSAAPGSGASPGESAAKGWRNVVSCMCSVTISAKGTVLDKSACSVHGKAAKA